MTALVLADPQLVTNRVRREARVDVLCAGVVAHRTQGPGCVRHGADPGGIARWTGRTGALSDSAEEQLASFEVLLDEMWALVVDEVRQCCGGGRAREVIASPRSSYTG